jgi:hypothetical protein
LQFVVGALALLQCGTGDRVERWAAFGMACGGVLNGLVRDQVRACTAGCVMLASGEDRTGFWRYVAR